MKNNKIAFIFLLFLTISSLIFHLNKRNNHFQETDSSLVYEIIKNKPNSIIISNTSSFQSEFLFDNKNSFSDFAFKYFDIENQLNKFKKRKISHEEVDYYKKINLIRIIRVGILYTIINLNLPRPITTFFILPLSTTYSPIIGLIYGFITNKNYESFMSTGLLITIISFHLSIIFFFTTLLNFKINIYISLLTSILFLLSISSYSYSYHLGSTTWNITTSIIWLFLFSKYYIHKLSHNNLVIYSIFFLFCNYLIIFYFMFFLMFSILSLKNISLNTILKKLFSKPNIFFYLFVLIIIIFFLPFGQGFRSELNISTFSKIPLVLFGIYEGSHLINNFQSFFISIVFIIPLLFYKKIKSNFIIIYKTLVFFIFLLFIFHYTSFLSIGPTRQQLFILPILYLLIALNLQLVYNYYIVLFLLAVVIITSPYSLLARSKKMENLITNDLIQKNYDVIITNDKSFQISNKFINTKIYLIIDILRNKINLKGKRVLYISQTYNFIKEEPCYDFAARKYLKNSNMKIIWDIKVENNKSILNNVFFTPFIYKWEFQYTRPNNLYVTEFYVNDFKYFYTNL
jgi:hypothetical protein